MQMNVLVGLGPSPHVMLSGLAESRGARCSRRQPLLSGYGVFANCISFSSKFTLPSPPFSFTGFSFHFKYRPAQSWKIP